MAGLAEYIFCVCCAALLCGIVNSMMPKGASKEILKLVGGLFLAFTVIRPVADLQIPELSGMGSVWQEEAMEAVNQGEEMARQAAAEGIKQQLEAYILDKARQLGLEVRAQLKLNEDTFHPEEVTIIANASPNVRKKLNRWLSEELGLTEEDILWLS